MDSQNESTSFVKTPFTEYQYKGMPYRNLGNSGLKVPPIGLGTWKIGYPERGDESRINEKTAFELFDRAMELGVCFWDTANRYNNGSGNSERIIGSWIKRNSSERRNLILATKIGGLMDGRTPNHCGLSRLNIWESVQACIDRLQVNYIDLLYFHAFDPETPIEESLDSIEDLVRKGIVRYFGVSNFTVDQLISFDSWSRKNSVKTRIVVVQNQFDIIQGENEKYKGVLEYANQKGIAFIAWSPLRKGLLTEKYLEANKIGRGDRLYDEGINEYKDDFLLREKIQLLANHAHQWNITVNQLAIAYMLQLQGMGPVIASCSSVKQLESNATAGRIQLTSEQLQRINELLLT